MRVVYKYIPRLKGTDEDLQQQQHRHGGSSRSSVGGLNVIKTYALAKLTHTHEYTHTHTNTHSHTRGSALVVLSESYSAHEGDEVCVRGRFKEGVKGLGNVTAPQPLPPAAAAAAAATFWPDRVPVCHKVFYSFYRINLRAPPIRPLPVTARKRKKLYAADTPIGPTEP